MKNMRISNKDVFRQMSKMFGLLSFMLVGLMCISCAPLSRPALDTPLSFEVATRMMAYDLFAQIANKQQLTERYQDLTFVTDAIINADTGDEITASRRVNEIIVKTAVENFPKYSVKEMNSDNVGQANFVIIGVLKQETYGDVKSKLPHLFLSVVEMKTSQIIAHSEVWISGQNQELQQPTPLYSDSPMYIKDSRVEALIATAKATSGTAASREYFNTLATTALLAEASKAYDKGEYNLALGLFAKVAERDDGLVMKTFAGLYQTFFKLNRASEAEEAFAKLAELGIKSGNLSVKFLFKVNDTDFFGEPSELAEYNIWLRQIANKIVESNACVEISGHASRSGSAEYNNKLSHKRALEIQQQLQGKVRGVSEKTTAIGRGFEENIVGTGTNDIRDAIDRRVEFKLIDCNNPKQDFRR